MALTPKYADQHPNVQSMEKAGEIKGRSLWEDARRRLFANKAAVASMFILFILLMAAIFWPMLSPHAFNDINYSAIDTPPSPEYWMGTDNSGRDILVRDDDWCPRLTGCRVHCNSCESCNRGGLGSDSRVLWRHH